MSTVKFFTLLHQITLFLAAMCCIVSCQAQGNTRQQKEASAKHSTLVRTQATGPHDNVFCSLRDKTGALWFGTTGEGVYRYDGNSFTNYTTRDGLNSNTIRSIIEDRARHIILGTDSGISRYDGISFVDMTKNSALSHSSISSLLEDKKGRLWIGDYKDGSYDSGVYFYDPSYDDEDGFVDFYTVDHIQRDGDFRLLRTNGLEEDNAGNIWFVGQNADDLVRYDGNSLLKITFTEEVGSYGFVYRSMILDKKGTLWLGTQRHGALTYVPAADKSGKNQPPSGQASFVHFTEESGPGHSCVMAILEDSKGNVWFCTDGEGVWRYDGRFYKNFNTEDGLLNNSVFSAVEDQKGNLWFGTRDVGLYRFDGTSFVKFSE